MTAADCSSRRARSATAACSGSVLAPNTPPISTSSNSVPSHSTEWRITSRVVPATGATIALRLPATRLNNVDFPTFGRPTSTTRKSPLAFSDMVGAGCASPPSVLTAVNYRIYASYTPEHGAT